MEIVNIEARTFEAMLSKFEVFANRMEKLCTLYGDMSQRTWLDNQDVCLMLNISHEHYRPYVITAHCPIHKSATRHTISPKMWSE